MILIGMAIMNRHERIRLTRETILTILLKGGLSLRIFVKLTMFIARAIDIAIRSGTPTIIIIKPNGVPG